MADKGKGCWLHAITLFGALAVGLGFSASGFGVRADGLFMDFVVKRLGAPRPVDNPMVVLISETDYEKAATPLALWGTQLVPLFERFVADRPEAVGLDLILPQFPLSSFLPDHDRRLLKALNSLSKTCRLVSGYGIAPDGRIMEPFVFYRKVLGPEGLGFLNLTFDEDGVCRKQVLTLPAEGNKFLFSFSSLLAGIRGSPGQYIVPDWRNPAVIRTVTYEEAMNSNPGHFSGKTVLIGVNFQFEDRHPSPVVREGEAGVVLHARFIEALRSGRVLHDIGWLGSTFVPALLVVAISLITMRKGGQGRNAILGAVILPGFLLFSVGAIGLSAVLRPSAGLVGAAVVLAVRMIDGYVRVRETFGRYVSRQVRDEILSGRIPLDGEVKEVTVLFTDLRNFTPMVETTPPKAVIRILNQYFQEMGEVIRSHSGLVLQYAGDEIMAVFGAPLPLADHGRWAVLAGLEMRERLRILNVAFSQTGYPSLRHGIGIHSGEVVAANVGGAERVSYTLIGDTVNLASRLQGLNKEFGTDIIVSGECRQRLGDDIAVKQLPTVPIKGKSKPVEIFAVLQRNPPGT